MRQSIHPHYVMIFVLVGTLVIHWYAYGSGVLLTSDSYHYLAARNTFLHDGNFVDNDGHHFLFWPPLFPVILSALASPQQQMSLVNIIIVVLFAFFIHKIIKLTIQNAALALYCFIFIIGGVHLLLVSSYLWTELIFLFLTTLFIYTLLQAKKYKYFIYLTVLTGFLMCFQRNAGLFILSGASIWLFINESKTKPGFIKSAVFFLFVASGSFIWNFYVWINLPHDHFDFSVEPFQYAGFNFNSLAYAIVNAFVPIKYFSVPLLIAGCIFLVYRLRKRCKEETVQLLFIISSTYLFFLSLVLVVNIGGFPVAIGEADRFISVVIPFLAILVFKSLEPLVSWHNRFARKLSMLLIVLWLAYPLGRTIVNARLWHTITAKNTTAGSLPVLKKDTGNVHCARASLKTVILKIKAAKAA